MAEEILFEEKQYFKQWWLIVLMGIIVGVLTYYLIDHIINYKIVYGNSNGYIAVIIIIVSIILFCLAFFFINLKTRITNQGIYIRYFPFHSKYKFVPWEQIIDWSIITYKPVLEYGGWGVRGTKKNKVFNVSGKDGLKLTLNDGSTILIGTQKPEKLKNQLNLKK